VIATEVHAIDFADSAAIHHNQVAEILTGSDTCVAVLNGHYHPGGFCVDRATYFWGMEGVVETADDGNAFAVVKLGADSIDVAGAGITASRSLPLLKKRAE
jgi:hypothetical protein